MSANNAYLETARGMPNLTVRSDALVEHIVFSGPRATGVSVRYDGTNAPVVEHAEEIVLSAGAIHSPTILLRSGIGPAEQLRDLDIEVRADLPVGRGLQDHPMVLVELALTDDAAVATVDDRHTNVCVRYASAPEAADGDMLLTSMNQNVLSMAGADATAHAGAFGVWVNRPHSRGAVTLTSSNPFTQPAVAERMLSDEHDLTRLRAGIRQLVELAQHPDGAAITAKPPEKSNPELFAVLDDDAALDEYLLANALDAQHATSTCRMGATDDASTVVDPSCRVHGCDGLRVIDASIFPDVPRANTNLATIMAGELMADRLD